MRPRSPSRPLKGRKADRNAEHMRTWGLETFGLDNLRLSTLALPVRKSGELLVRVNAASLGPHMAELDPNAGGW